MLTSPLRRPTTIPVCLALTLLLGVAMLNPASAQTSTDPRPALEKLLHLQEAAWNNGDAVTWCSVFTEDADFINIIGTVLHGRDIITERHARIFAGPYKGSHATITIRLLTEVSPGVVILDTDHDVTNYAFLPPGIAPTAPGILRTRMKYIAVKHGDQWQFVSAQNTAITPPPPPPK